jgi:hypothetical protein
VSCGVSVSVRTKLQKLCPGWLNLWCLILYS